MSIYRMLLTTFLFLLILIAIPVVQEARSDSSDEMATSEETETEEDDEFEDFDEEDDADFGEEGGFEDIEVNLDAIKTTPVKESFFVFGGFVKEEIDYSHAYDDPDFSKLKSTLNLNLDLKLGSDWKAKINWNTFYDYSYSHRGRDEFTDETLETYESESEFREVFLEGGITDWLRVKVGRQFIAWGQAESTQITDVANPRDLTELGMVDLEDARIPVAATKLSFLSGSAVFDAVAIHEIRGNKMPAAGSEFDVFKSLRDTSFIDVEDEEIPDSGVENTEYLFRFFKTFNGGDFGLMWAEVYEDYPHLDFDELALTDVQSTPAYQLTVVPKHKRIQTYGFSANMVSGSWLFKTELARKVGMALARSDDNITEQLTAAIASADSSGYDDVTYDEDSDIIEMWTEKNTHSAMLGVEYSGVQDLTISLEVVGERIEEYEDNLSSKETTAQTVLIVTYKALNDTFDAQLFWIHLTDSNGDVYRVNLEYDIIDALSVSGGFIEYIADDKEATIYNYRNNDRVFISLKYSF